MREPIRSRVENGHGTDKVSGETSIEAAFNNHKTLYQQRFCWWAGSESNTRHKDFQSLSDDSKEPDTDDEP